jgi:divinyl protochlorophyllide a 8-vinyl-reductase
VTLHARIGPNAVTQLAAAFDAQAPHLKHAIFARAHVEHWLDTPPVDMVDETDVAHLHQHLRQNLAPDMANKLLHEAGLRTADYILANRIPRLFRVLLPRLPRSIAAKLLVSAITRHAWTFAGTGRCRTSATYPLTVEIANNPFCRHEHGAGPVCIWHEAVFTRLFAELVHPDAQAKEITCGAAGDQSCRFVILWPQLKTWIQIKARIGHLLPFLLYVPDRQPVSKDQTRAP